MVIVQKSGPKIDRLVGHGRGAVALIKRNEDLSENVKSTASFALTGAVRFATLLRGPSVRDPIRFRWKDKQNTNDS
jgi:hypothetical protein